MGRVVGGFNFFFVVDWISSLLSRACCEVMAMVGLLCFNIQVITYTMSTIYSRTLLKALPNVPCNHSVRFGRILMQCPCNKKLS